MKKVCVINLIGLSFVIVVVAITMKLLNGEGDCCMPSPPTTQAAVSRSMESNYVQTVSRSGGSTASLMVVVLVFGVLDFGVFLWAKSSIDGICNNRKLSHQVKLEKIKNEEVLLDIPLYLGLGGTVLGFLMIAKGIPVSRELAYVSTVLGIIATAIMRVWLLRLRRSKLLEDLIKDQK